MKEEIKRDITTLEDIQLMVDTFYEKVNQDDKLSPIFNDFARVAWQSHLPIMYRFWGSLILGEPRYNGHPFAKHIPLPIDSAHFSRWVMLFEASIDELFEGEVAEQTKLRARSIAVIFERKKEYVDKLRQ